MRAHAILENDAKHDGCFLKGKNMFEMQVSPRIANYKLALITRNENRSKLLISMMEDMPDLDCVSAFTLPHHAMSVIPELKPHIAMLDMEMPEMSGVELGLCLRKQISTLKLLLVADSDNTGLCHLALSAGVNGFLAKPFHKGECQVLIRSVLYGCRVVSSSASQYWDRQFNSPHIGVPIKIEISNRQIALIEKLAQGHTNKQMAHDFQVGVSTIHKWLHVLYGRLGVHSAKEAVARWYKPNE